MNDQEWEIREKATAIAYREFGDKSLSIPAWLAGLGFLMVNAMAITLYEGVQYSDFEFRPSTVVATCVALSASFASGFLLQRERWQMFNTRRDELIKQITVTV